MVSLFPYIGMETRKLFEKTGNRQGNNEETMDLKALSLAALKRNCQVNLQETIGFPGGKLEGNFSPSQETKKTCQVNLSPVRQNVPKIGETLPSFCKVDCSCFEHIDGIGAGCVQHHPDGGEEWNRLAKVASCPRGSA